MSTLPPGAPVRKGRKRVAILVAVVVVVAALAAVLAAIYLPVNSASQKVLVSTAGGSTASMALPSSVYATMHASYHGAEPMMYSMNGPGGGMMYNHARMTDGDSYSFWSNGGMYECWAGYQSGGYGPVPVWFNATWGML
ncbi:MAG: hypothetical protein KGJ23_00235 [Euryarchaeota archaeon]|nr:hypothetical protein [Euryarchaeota archaeon]MDE1835023.1 hypothetical protein [Euryarchaeota archaeon]MDE1881344.1 hypothetical protein [Euryarchaeota archaeon]MDE2044862.1 hypothetical protein [Thermoplasmata archaeon]